MMLYLWPTIFQEVIQNGFFHALNPNGHSDIVSVNMEPFGKNFDIHRHFNKARKERQIMERPFLTFSNLVQVRPRTWKNPWHAFNIQKMDYFLFPRTQELCRGEKVIINAWLAVIIKGISANTVLVQDYKI